jgi:hypothetical protein
MNKPAESEHMTIQEFKDGIECGRFSGWIGPCKYAIGDTVSKEDVILDDVMGDLYPQEYTHIRWYYR